MYIQFHCPGCEKEVLLPLPVLPNPWKCPGCAGEFQTSPPGRLAEGEPVSRCGLCGGERFYTQRDFSQRLGCLVAGIGAALSPFTYGISLLVCLVADLVVYFLVGEATICYRCGAIYRGTTRNPRHVAFDLHVADMDREERKYLERETPS